MNKTNKRYIKDYRRKISRKTWSVGKPRWISLTRVQFIDDVCSSDTCLSIVILDCQFASENSYSIRWKGWFRLQGKFEFKHWLMLAIYSLHRNALGFIIRIVWVSFGDFDFSFWSVLECVCQALIFCGIKYVAYNWNASVTVQKRSLDSISL